MKKLLSGLNAFILTVALLVFGLSLSIVSAFNSPQPAKDGLAESGIYEEFVGEAIDDSEGVMKGIIRAEPPIQGVVVNAAVPYVREDMEKGIENLYAWIKDPSQSVSITVDAAEAREPVSKAVGNYVQERIERMPVCQSTPRNFNPNNPFTWDCRLENTNIASYNDVFATLVSREPFWENTVYDMDDLFGITEEELTSDYRVAPDTYGGLIATAWISGIIAVLSIIATWFLTRSVRRMLRRVGISFIVVGALLIIVSIVASVVTAGFVTELKDGDELDMAMGGILGNITGIMAAWLLQSGAIALVIGLAGLLGSFFIKKDGGAGTVEPTSPQTPQPTPPTSSPMPPQNPQDSTNPPTPPVQ